jgi:MFS family permease
MYQAVQNGSYGFGAICGASFGGAIVDSIGWRWCFLVQVPVSLMVLVLGYFVLEFPAKQHHHHDSAAQQSQGIWHKIDLSGACLLVLALSSQLVGLSLGGNELPWTNVWVILSLVASVVFLALFVYVEANTKAVPLIPLKMLRGVLPVSTQIANVCVGMAAYAVSSRRVEENSGRVTNFETIVPLYHPATLPSHSTGQSHESRCTTGHSIPRHPPRRPDFRDRDVPLGKIGLARTYRRRSDVHR